MTEREIDTDEINLPEKDSYTGGAKVRMPKWSTVTLDPEDMAHLFNAIYQSCDCYARKRVIGVRRIVNQPGRGQYTMRIKCENPACEAFCVDIKEAVTMEPEIVIQNVQ